jgi:SAM-dependent methyltransferase
MDAFAIPLCLQFCRVGDWRNLTTRTESSLHEIADGRPKLTSDSDQVAMKHLPYYFRILCSAPYGVVRRITGRTCSGYAAMVPYLRDKVGLEIGGPSRIFAKRHLIPVYNLCQRVDNCNFGGQTIWSSSFKDSGFDHRVGEQIVAEGSELRGLPDGKYDFVLASHVLEHIANPLRALLEWKRVLKAGGGLFVIVPDKRRTFDHKRPFTAIEHIESDFQANTQEDDLTHVDEILAMHDLSLDPLAGSRQSFRERCLQNHSFRAMHHHVYSPEVLGLMLQRLGLRVLSLSAERPYHIIGFAQKVGSENAN